MRRRAWFPGSDLAGVATAMITHKGPCPRCYPAMTGTPSAPGISPSEDFADPLPWVLSEGRHYAPWSMRARPIIGLRREQACLVIIYRELSRTAGLAAGDSSGRPP
jgi:hypothetical protein